MVIMIRVKISAWGRQDAKCSVSKNGGLRSKRFGNPDLSSTLLNYDKFHHTFEFLGCNSSLCAGVEMKDEL